MTYLDFELSQHDGEPVETFKFTGSSKNYLYTSAEVALVVAGETYLPATIQRKPIRTGSQSDDKVELEVQMPIDLDVVKDYAYTSSPQRLVLEVKRAHRLSDLSVEYIPYWKGRVSSFKVEGAAATMLIPSALSRILQGAVPPIYYQNPCNHNLFDARCKVSKVGNSTFTTVTLVGPSAITVVSDGFADSFLKAGEIRVDRNDERRLVLDNVANVVTINFPFFDILIGDLVELVGGCDHAFASSSGCLKYSNQLNYGGHPYIPADNPFLGSL